MLFQCMVILLLILQEVSAQSSANFDFIHGLHGKQAVTSPSLGPQPKVDVLTHKYMPNTIRANPVKNQCFIIKAFIRI
ncbi:unnamed protein product [Callosobruchus maculatus]|uniref:Uncharacterized protein n=1 Tax=Callosobruchus maculatus TaxID=64391 RepID=A0A653DK88_CALMS|nr:unnamed protein product [Callosobruchus maculatus]